MSYASFWSSSYSVVGPAVDSNDQYEEATPADGRTWKTTDLTMPMMMKSVISHMMKMTKSIIRFSINQERIFIRLLKKKIGNQMMREDIIMRLIMRRFILSLLRMGMPATLLYK